MLFLEKDCLDLGYCMISRLISYLPCYIYRTTVLMWIVPKRAEIVQRTKTRIVEIGGRWILLICKIFHFFITFLLKQFFGMTDIASLSWTETNLSCELKRKSCKKRKIPSESIWSDAVMTKNRITETFWGSESLNKKSRLRLTFEISAGQMSFV